MTIEYKCRKEVLPNVWHHNLIIDDKKMLVKENSEVPALPETIIDMIKDGIAFPEDGWKVDC